MSNQFQITIEQLKQCNIEFYLHCQQDDVDESILFLNKRDSLLEKLALIVNKEDSDECLSFATICQEILNANGNMIQVAVQQKEEIAEQLGKIKHAQKALPAYQLHIKK